MSGNRDPKARIENALYRLANEILPTVVDIDEEEKEEWHENVVDIARGILNRYVHWRLKQKGLKLTFFKLLVVSHLW
jgi:hypothetical protein